MSIMIPSCAKICTYYPSRVPFEWYILCSVVHMLYTVAVCHADLAAVISGVRNEEPALSFSDLPKFLFPMTREQEASYDAPNWKCAFQVGTQPLGQWYYQHTVQHLRVADGQNENILKSSQG